MNWSSLFAPDPPYRWVVVMAGHDVVLELRKALPGRRYRVLPARDYEELEQRVSIVVPAMILVEIPDFEAETARQLQGFHRLHPLIPLIAVLDDANSDLSPILVESGARKTLVKPIDCRMVRRTIETEVADSRLGWQDPGF